MQKSALIQGALAGTIVALAILTLARPPGVAADAPTTAAQASKQAPSVAVDGARASPTTAVPPAQPPSFRPPPNPLEMQAQNLASARAASTRLEARWSAAPPDGAAAETEQLLAAAARAPDVTAVPFQPERYAARCRKAMCRIEAQFPGGTEPNEWATRLLLQAGSQLQSSSTVVLPGEGGKYDVVIYAFRPGSTPWN